MEKIKEEFTLITSLSSELSTRYQRPETSIMVVLSHSSCLMMGGSFDPAYILTITALPEYVQQATNQRNSFLIQKLIQEVLGVPNHRGIIRFVAVPEEMLGTKGTTVLGLMKQSEPGLARALTSRSSNLKSLHGDKRKSLASPTDFTRKASMRSVISTKERDVIADPVPAKSRHSEGTSTSTRAGATGVRSGDGPGTGFDVSNAGGKGHSASPPMSEPRPPSAMKSILKMTGQSEFMAPSPPPVPEEPKIRMKKRKSLMTIFKRDKLS